MSTFYTVELDLETHNVGLAPKNVIRNFLVSHRSKRFIPQALWQQPPLLRFRDYGTNSQRRHPELITTSLGNAPFYNCTIAPFTFTWNDSAEEVNDRFINWTEACLSGRPASLDGQLLMTFPFNQIFPRRTL